MPANGVPSTCLLVEINYKLQQDWLASSFKAETENQRQIIVTFGEPKVTSELVLHGQLNSLPPPQRVPRWGRVGKNCFQNCEVLKSKLC